MNYLQNLLDKVNTLSACLNDNSSVKQKVEVKNSHPFLFLKNISDVGKITGGGEYSKSFETSLPDFIGNFISKPSEANLKSLKSLIGEEVRSVSKKRGRIKRKRQPAFTKI